MSDEVPMTPPTPATPPAAAVEVIARRRGPSWFGVIVVAAITAAIVGLVAGLAGYTLGQRVDAAVAPAATPETVALPQVTKTTTPPRSGSIAGLAAAALPSVVSILAEGATESGSGSGFVIRPDGYVLTNNHVVDLVGKNGKLTVVLPDGTKYPGKVLGVNQSYDLAVVKIGASDLPELTFGDSDHLHVGDGVVAIGAPLGLDGTVTSGIISALDRPVTTGDTQAHQSFINAIQTDAAINPGNSGGPLLDADGHVIGINSAIASMATYGEAGSIGLGFAIPINTAKRIAEELMVSGKSTTPALGVSVDTTFAGPGAKVREVTAGGAADQAGIKVGDTILTVGGRVIDDPTELVVAVRSHAPGESVALAIRRDGLEKSISVTLGSLPDAG